ncbi:tRNA (N6-isopentenyl adenosine(37)-C2)-methylthiotransferase MiaB [Daejeonella oryzae]|uniref:tRNA (N6-isopentenyl adenosine(37)-C2)-methylthiotransferase MiaB n=1 Tax=Daejeonella oryzae TaxID=1122943 RepID=UPI0003F6E71E|nr:tRNA (N6-isopentenyl adenosine(37)-C2)-methylthiotransferase MiaB [Daejeonella oryzae]
MLGLQASLKDHDESRQGEALVLDGADVKHNRKLFIESYGCAMNFSDSEIVASIMSDMGFSTTSDYKEADVIFINTCSIRDNAEQRVRNRLKEFSAAKVKNPGITIGVLGCMAERLKSKFLEEEKLVDLVIGPDAYRDLPNLIGQVDDGNRAVNVLLSREETYADISPVRLNTNGISAFISIMRGCDNMCSFCVVPFTRGRERSRDPQSIVREAEELFNKGYREVTLLGQNVDSYKYPGAEAKEVNDESPSGYGQTVNFARLLELVANINPELRVRFSTSHPKDITDEVLYTMARHENICKHIHLPVQSGNSRILEMMNRTYTREWYIDRVDAIRRIMPECGISTDIIIGFCSETEEEHQETLSMMEYVKYDFAYMFTYSERPGTLAAKRYPDDIPEEVKKRRFNEILAKQQECSSIRLEQRVGKTFKVLIERNSKKSATDFSGKSDQNTTVVFPADNKSRPGDYVHVLIEKCTPATLIGKIVG